MNTCNTCKHWDKAAQGERGHSFGFGRCSATPLFWDATEWDGTHNGRRLRAEYKQTKAFVQDGSDYRADLITAPDFGCVQHEAA